MSTEIRTTTKVEEDRSFGDKVKDFAHNLKEKVTGEGHVKDSDIACAAHKHDELKNKEELDRFRAEGASERKDQLLSDTQRLQNKELEQRKQEEKHFEQRQEQADKVAHLQNKQSEQQAKKCHEALKKEVVAPSDTGYKVTRTTEIH